MRSFCNCKLTLFNKVRCTLRWGFLRQPCSNCCGGMSLLWLIQRNFDNMQEQPLGFSDPPTRLDHNISRDRQTRLLYIALHKYEELQIFTYTLTMRRNILILALVLLTLLACEMPLTLVTPTSDAVSCLPENTHLPAISVTERCRFPPKLLPSWYRRHWIGTNPLPVSRSICPDSRNSSDAENWSMRRQCNYVCQGLLAFQVWRCSPGILETQLAQACC